MKNLVVQQLGHKYMYDSSLNDLENYMNPDGEASELVTAQGTTYEPLEQLIKNALNYDSTVYRQALGISQNDYLEPNGVMKSQEF